MVPDRAIPICYNPDNRTQAVWDNHPCESLAEERAACYHCQKHPDDLSCEQRMELLKNGMTKKALPKSFRLIGKEEAGDWEAEVTVRITDNAAGDTVINRPLYLSGKLLRHMVSGKYIDISVVPGKENFFGIVTDMPRRLFLRKAGLKCQAGALSCYENVVLNTDGHYAPCRGCFACWLKNTGYCVMDDSLKHAGALIRQRDSLIIISRLCYGGYGPGVKAVSDRAIGVSLPFFYLAGRPNPPCRALPAAKTAAHSLLRRLYGIGTVNCHRACRAQPAQSWI